MGDARRRKLAGGPKFRPKPEPGKPSLARSPEEIEAAIQKDEAARNHVLALMSAAIDFINQSTDDAERRSRLHFSA
jgi:hypothetical protein